MSVRVPRITLQTDFGDEASFGDLSLLSLGYGLHQAWIYASMFGTSSVFGTQIYLAGGDGSYISIAFLVSIVVFGLCLLFAAITDQRFLRFYVSKKLLVAGAITTTIGTLLLLPAGLSASYPLEILSGILTGLGSATLTLFWGVAFARCEGSSIIINAATAIPVGIVVYGFFLHAGPFPYMGIIASIIPLLELIILWKKTPRPFSERAEIPVFKPLPINHARFRIKFGLPVCFFGIALGILRQTSLQHIIPATDVTDQLLLFFAACIATILIFVTVLAINGTAEWVIYFKTIIPFAAIALLIIPSQMQNFSLLSNVLILVGYLSFEALAWTFFGNLAQNLRLSPIMVFGLGRGLLALSSLLGSLITVTFAHWIETVSLGEEGIAAIALLILGFAYMLLPRRREIEAIVIPCPFVKAVSLELDEGFGPLRRKPLNSPLAEQTGAADSSADATSPTGSSAKANGALTATAAEGLRSEASRIPPTHPHAAQVQQEVLPSSHAVHETQGVSNQAAGSQTASGAAFPSISAESARTIKKSQLEHQNEAQAEQSQYRRRRFHAQVETVANTYLLSRRETEILFFLAKGHNAAYIQEKLYISEGTAKTHIRHIYRKTNVHSQQQLMRLVESIEPTPQ